MWITLISELYFISFLFDILFFNVKLFCISCYFNVLCSPGSDHGLMKPVRLLWTMSQVSMDADGHRFSTSPSCWIRLHPPVNQLLLQINEVHVISPEVHVTQICSDSLPARLGASALQTSRSFQQDPLNMLQTRLTHLKPVSHSLIQTETLTV